MLGTVSPYETATGTRWRFQAPPRLDPVTGETVRPGRAGFLTQAEAEMEQIKYNASIGTLTVETTASLREVLLRRIAEAAISNGSKTTYSYNMTRLPDWLLDMPIGEIDKGHVETMVVQKLEERMKSTGRPYSRDYMSSLVTLVSGAFTYAQNKRVPLANPCTEVSVKRLVGRYFDSKSDWRAGVIRGNTGMENWKEGMLSRAVGKGPVWSRQQVVDFLGVQPYPWIGYFATTFFQALRRGESLGMSWDRTDLSDEVAAALIQETIALNAGQVHVNPTPKSGQTRIALLDAYVIEELKKHKKYQDEVKAEHPNWSGDWVFTSFEYRTSRDWFPGKFIRPDSPPNRIILWARDNRADQDGVRVLRRTWANIAANALGIPPYVIMRVLGHSGETVTTEHYTQATDAQVRAALKAVREHVLGG